MGKQRKRKFENREILERGSFQHYTTSVEFAGISQVGTIIATKLGDNEKNDFVWLSTDPLCERSVMRIVDLADDKKSEPMELFDAYKHGLIPIRIKVNQKKIKLLSWEKVCRKGLISNETLFALNEISKRFLIDKSKWFACQSNIVITDWSTVDVQDGDMWISYKFDF